MAGHTGTRPSRLRFHAVTVIAGADACPLALSIKGVRLLSAEEPRLPLRGCDRPDGCTCRFKHHDDRRAGPRRRFERGSPVAGGVLLERRSLRGRRAVDWPDDD